MILMCKEEIGKEGKQKICKERDKKGNEEGKMVKKWETSEIIRGKVKGR